MINRIDATPPQTIVADHAPKQQKPHQPKAAAPAQDTVSISSATLNGLLTKPVEALETYAQTLKEANAGDPKAIAKLEKK